MVIFPELKKKAWVDYIFFQKLLDIKDECSPDLSTFASLRIYKKKIDCHIL